MSFVKYMWHNISLSCLESLCDRIFSIPSLHQKISLNAYLNLALSRKAIKQMINFKIHFSPSGIIYPTHRSGSLLQQN